jgi:DNA-binding CsgD family transcriptional regulator
LLDYRHIEVATRIGMLTRERDAAAACDEALRALGAAMPTDAATLVGLDPFTGEHVQLTGIGYTPAVSNRQAADFVRTPWHHKLMTGALPESISGESGQSFRQGWFYAEHVRPAGFRDAMTGALRHRGRYVGLINIATERADAFGTDARHLLGAVLPALAALADLLGRVGDAEAVPPGAQAALVTADDVAALPGHDRPPMLDDTAFRQVTAEFARWAGHRLRILWPVGRAWYRVCLSHHHLPGNRPGAVLVHCRPTDIPYGLSPRELDVMTRTAMGQSNQTIAQGLYLSPRTVHSHVEHILRKTGAASRAEVAALAVREDLVRPTPGMAPHAGLEFFLRRSSSAPGPEAGR